MKRLLLFLLAIPALAQERSLYWDEVAVRARLDAQGRLNIREQQAYVFNGDWNGGERKFRVEKGQRFEFHGISRVDAAGNIVPLSRGSLDRVDNYDFVDDTTLRWRSRTPSDPPFRNERITYILDYTLANILVKKGDRYVLDHDFAFPERAGNINRFTLDVDLAPEWSAVDLQHRIELGPLRPGQSAIVRGTLEYRGAGAAPGARRSTLPIRAALAAIVVLVPIVLWRRFLRRETALGRFAPLVTSTITPKWIEENILPLRAEVAGATWDESVTANEVSAILARWAAEEKVVTTVESAANLSMRLNVPRETFAGYERDLIDRLFFAGTETNTAAIRDHYKKSGFNPTNIIARPLLAEAQQLAHMKEPAPRESKMPTLILFLVSALLFVIGLRNTGNETFFAVAMLWVVGLCWMIGIFLALKWRGRIDYGLPQSRGFLICVGIAVAAVAVLLLANWFSWTAKLAFAAAGLMIANNILNVASSKKGASAIAFRKRLASVRQYFIDELRKSQPGLDDRWFPYIVAFGLDSEASAWMREFGGRSDTTRDSWTSSSSTSSSGTSSPQWSGGGGAFGGAGATGAWTAAAAGMAAGVASASSDSGGGGGGGGSSSGGGGGGGW